MKEVNGRKRRELETRATPFSLFDADFDALLRVVEVEEDDVDWNAGFVPGAIVTKPLSSPGPRGRVRVSVVDVANEEWKDWHRRRCTPVGEKYLQVVDLPVDVARRTMVVPEDAGLGGL
ncbi:MAG: hypothetical protein Kow0069_36450 [Promethearchaeota archaeon]